MNSKTNGADTNTTIFASTNAGNYAYVDWSSWQPFEDTPPTALALAETGLAYIYAGLLLLWEALVEWLRGLWR